MTDGLRAFAEKELVLGARQADGSTLREHLQSVERQTGETPQALAEDVECPASMQYLWEYFLMLNVRRNQQRDAIGNVEVLAWAELNGVRLAPFEMRALDAIEAEYLADQRRKVEAAAAGLRR